MSIHAARDNENDATTSIVFTVEDNGGDPANGSHLRFDDDMPRPLRAGGDAHQQCIRLFNGALDFGDVNGLTNNYGVPTVERAISATGASGTEIRRRRPGLCDLEHGKTLTATAGAAGPLYHRDISGSNYTIDMNGSNRLNYTDRLCNGWLHRSGGNDPWLSFAKPAVPNSPDLWSPRSESGARSGTVNLNANLFGSQAGIRLGKRRLRIDFVTDVKGTRSRS